MPQPCRYYSVTSALDVIYITRCAIKIYVLLTYLPPDSRVPNRGGSDTLAPRAGTKSVPALEASVGLAIKAEPGPDLRGFYEGDPFI